jgi:hypothetical protein
MTSDSRVDAVDAYLKAIRTTESSALEWLERSITDDVELVIQPARTSDPKLGRKALIEYLSREWPLTPAYALAGFGDPEPGPDGGLVVHGVFPPLGAVPKGMSIAFDFDSERRIRRVVQTTEMNMAPGAAMKVMPPDVRAAINGALAARMPLVFAYTNADGNPSLSVRGSVQVYSATQLCMWMRPGSRFETVLAQNPNLGLAYTNLRDRSALLISGIAEIAAGEERDRVYNLIPEVEQTHDPERRGEGVIINVTEINGWMPSGTVNVKP